MSTLLKSPDDIIKQQAKRLADGVVEIYRNDQKLAFKLDGELNIHSSDRNKIKFLKEVEEEIIRLYNEHLPKCTSPSNCKYNKAYEKTMALVQDRCDTIEPMVLNSIANPGTNFFFANNEEFDAKIKIFELIESAKHEIILIDGYVDQKTLEMLKANNSKPSIKILTFPKSINSKLEVLADAFRKQYGQLQIKPSNSFHDRFLIVDSLDFYHVGTSFKDVGNKAFMFTQVIDEEIKNHVLTKFNKEWI